MSDMTQAIEFWADKNEITKQPVEMQIIKLMEEVGELAAAFYRNDQAGFDDAIGDIDIVLTALSYMTGASIDERRKAAYMEIIGRKIEIRNGRAIKEADLCE